MDVVLSMKSKVFLKIIIISLCLSFIVKADNVKSIETELGFQLDFQTVTYDQWLKTLDGYKDTILVVDMWATWCISCLERFPHMVEMNKKYAGKGVTFISLLLEDPEEPEAIVMAKKFLVKQQADFKHYFMNENLMLSFDKLDLLGIPAVFIYGKDGKLYQRLTGDNPNKQFTEDDIKNTIEKLIL